MRVCRNTWTTILSFENARSDCAKSRFWIWKQNLPVRYNIFSCGNQIVWDCYLVGVDDTYLVAAVERILADHPFFEFCFKYVWAFDTKLFWIAKFDISESLHLPNIRCWILELYIWTRIASRTCRTINFWWIQVVLLKNLELAS